MADQSTEADDLLGAKAEIRWLLEELRAIEEMTHRDQLMVGFVHHEPTRKELEERLRDIAAHARAVRERCGYVD